MDGAAAREQSVRGYLVASAGAALCARRIPGVEPKPSTVKQLMLASRNECAHDECYTRLYEPGWQGVLAVMCGGWPR